MKGLKAKLFTGISMFVLALSMLIVGVWAVGETQTITMSGSVNFEIADKSLYVKDVRMQEDVNSAPYSLKEQGRFMPGFINGNFDMNLGDFTNSYGAFALYFDIINTIDETTNETFAYTVDQPTAPSGTTVSVSILGSDGLALEQIPQGTVKPSQITESTPATATIKLTITSTSSSTVDLSEITITINQFIPQIYDYFTFEVNDDNQTVTLTDYDSSLSDSTDVVIPSTVSQNSSGEWIEGDTYTVTAIDNNATSSSNSIFRNSGITSINLPSTLLSIGNFALYGCSGLTSADLSGCTSLTSIGDSAFRYCSVLTGELNLGGCTSLTSIGERAFDGCGGLTGELNLGGCTSLTSIGYMAFGGCYGLTSISLPSSLTSIGGSAFCECSGLTSVDLSGCTSLTSIGSYAFERCRGLTGELNLGGCTSLTSIGDSAFSYCNGLTSISLPSSLTSIGSSAFWYCSNLTEVIIDSEYVYTNATSTSACGSLFDNTSISTVKVLTSLVEAGENSYISTNFTKGPTEVIGGKNYTVYSK